MLGKKFICQRNKVSHWSSHLTPDMCRPSLHHLPQHRKGSARSPGMMMRVTQPALCPITLTHVGVSSAVATAARGEAYMTCVHFSVVPLHLHTPTLASLIPLLLLCPSLPSLLRNTATIPIVFLASSCLHVRAHSRCAGCNGFFSSLLYRLRYLPSLSCITSSCMHCGSHTSFTQPPPPLLSPRRSTASSVRV